MFHTSRMCQSLLRQILRDVRIVEVLQRLELDR